MKKDVKFICSVCNKEYNKRDIKRINGICTCIFCLRKKRKKRRDYLLHEVAGVRRIADLRKEWKEKRKEKKKKRRFVSATKTNLPPKIKGEKRTVISKKVHLYLTRDEKKVLFKKFIKTMTNQDASDRVKYIFEKMSELAKKIRIEARENKLTAEQMNMKFLEGLAKYSEEE